MILKFNNFNDDRIINESYHMIDELINESIDYKEIWNKAVRKANGLSIESKKKILKYAFISLIAISSFSKVAGFIYHTISDNDKDIITEIVDENTNFKSGYDFKLSKAGWENIKEHESLKLKVYKLGDGMLTVGWGHAEPIKDTKLKVGQTISKEEAKAFLKDDLKNAADGVRRMFKQWEQKGDNVPISQPMFDALVSLAFNTGVSGLRNSEVVELLQQFKYKEAGERIKSFKISDKYPGLKIRREKESNLFMMGL